MIDEALTQRTAAACSRRLDSVRGYEVRCIIVPGSQGTVLAIWNGGNG